MVAEIFNKQRVVLAVPPGLEVSCLRTARRETGLRFERIAPGFIQSKERATDPRVIDLLTNAPIWTFGTFRLIAKNLALDDSGMDIAFSGLQSSVDEAGWRGESYWLTAPEGREQEWANTFLKRDFGLVNAPGNYSLTLRIITNDKGSLVLLGRSISVRDRFKYRSQDVIGSINPVLAACLVRLLPQDLSERSIDPTCGSGTLLFERLRYSNECVGLGIDHNLEAQDAFKDNQRGLHLPDQEIGFHLGDACDPTLWEPCSTVICNLPFGIRLRAKTEDLDALYLGILQMAQRHLSDNGRVLMTSSYKRGLDQAAESMSEHFKILSRYRAEMGGLFYQIYVFGRV